MNIAISEPVLRTLRHALAGLLLGAVLIAPAAAGTVSFGLSRSDNRLQLTNLGNTSAYHPQMYRLLADGQWQPLTPPPGQAPPVELAPNKSLTLIWPGSPPGQTDPAVGPFGAMLPALVRFFDQSGAAFGQLSFFSAPPPTATPLVAGYRGDGQLEIQPPRDPRIRATWLLWASESGIAPLTGAVVYEHHQPPARRIDWQQTHEVQYQRTSPVLPAVMLLHETNTGFEMQALPGGGLHGVEQRTLWLQATPGFYKLAVLALLAAVLALSWPLLTIWRKKK